MTRSTICWFLSIVGCFLTTIAAAEPLKLRARPQVGIAPADVEVKLHVEPGGYAREVLLELEGPRFFRSSIFPIRRDSTAPTVQPPAWYRSIPSGRYVVTAILSDRRCGSCVGRVFLARRELTLDIREGVGGQ